MPVAEQAGQDSDRESMAGLGLAEPFSEPTFSAPRFSPGRSAQETDHSKALPTLIWAEGGEASPDMQVRLCHQRSLNGPAGSALAVSRH